MSFDQPKHPMNSRRKFLLITGLALGLTLLWYALMQEAMIMRAGVNTPTRIVSNGFLLKTSNSNR